MKTKLLVMILIALVMFGCARMRIAKMTDTELRDSLKINYIPKAEWNALEVDESKMKPHKIEKITVHHAGVKYDGKVDSKIKTLGLQKFSLNTKGWGDVPYHVVIDLDGNVLEGRNPDLAGDTNTTYDPTGHYLLEVMGNYEVQILNEKQYDTLVKMCAFACLKYDISPETIAGHKDYASTACPGKDIYENYLQNGKLKKDVAKMLKDEFGVEY